MLQLTKGNCGIAACFGLALSAAGMAQADLATIDSELRSGIDFRHIDYRVCEDRQTCKVGQVQLAAQRRDGSDDAWVDQNAQLYCHPVDGIGVQGGGQNDEIDFEERIVVTFDTTVSVDKIWFSDLFRDEDSRYGAGVTDRVQGAPEDAETAGVQFVRQAEVLFNQIISANDPLPEDPFNEMLTPRFAEDGDLLRRVVIDGELVTLVVPGKDVVDRLDSIEVPLGQIDKDKSDLFDGLETVQIDLSDIITDFHNARLFTYGSHNFDYISAMLNDNIQLASLKSSAEAMRLQVDLSNGEQVAQALYTDRVDQLTFFAPFDASNDFSVAGIVLAPVTEAALHLPQEDKQ